MASQQKNNVIQNASNVKVVVRFRPLNEKEKAMGAVHCHELLDDKTTSIKDREARDNKQALKFTFDKVFDTNSTQENVYDYAASSVIDSVIEGFNGTIFAYGQTASGKTHTMEGDIGDKINQNSGIIPRMVMHVFSSISKAYENIEFRIKVSLTELYMEKLKDLLDQNKNDLKIRSDKKRGVFIEDLTQKYISSPEEVYKILETARNFRSIAVTNMNERSSRSHMIFILTISQNNTDDLSAKTGKLYLVDLAGSQKISKTGAEGKVLDEAKKINASLTALGKVINSLTDGKSTHIPYRDSKLTRVLQQSLGGNSKTSLIVTCSPHPNNMPETISTLRFGISAKKIKNTPKINKELTVAELQTQLEKMEKELLSRDQYIAQLKNYIMTDLRQKSIPQFQTERNVAAIQENDTDYLTELTRQLEMEKNLHMVQEEQINSLKVKCDQMSSEKQQLQKQNEGLKYELSIKAKELKENSHRTVIVEQKSSKWSTQDLLKQLQKITDDERVLNFISNQTELKFTKNDEHAKLLEDYEKQKDGRKEAVQKLKTYERNMQKKLVQLENNICQLTHAYYDLVVVQQRYKVDNIFLKKHIEERDITIKTMKEKIKDLEDQNRELQERGSNDDEDFQLGQKEEKKMKQSLEESSKRFDQIIEKKNPSTANPKIVKVIKGGNQ